MRKCIGKSVAKHRRRFAFSDFPLTIEKLDECQCSNQNTPVEKKTYWTVKLNFRDDWCFLIRGVNNHAEIHIINQREKIEKISKFIAYNTWSQRLVALLNTLLIAKCQKETRSKVRKSIASQLIFPKTEIYHQRNSKNSCNLYNEKKIISHSRFNEIV